MVDKTAAQEQMCDTWVRLGVYRHWRHGDLYLVFANSVMEATGEAAGM